MTKDKEKIQGEDVLEVLKGFIQQSAEHLDRIEKNMATKKDIEGVNARIDKVEGGLKASVPS